MSKFKSMYSPMKVVGIIFLVVTLVVAVSLTNNTVRQMISNSFAFDSVCAAKGDPKARNKCQVERDWEKKNSSYSKRLNDYTAEYGFWKNLYQNGNTTWESFNKAVNELLHRYGFGN